jgi:hypothetical protein
MSTQTRNTAHALTEKTSAARSARWASGTWTALAILTVLMLLVVMVGFPLAAIAYP